MANVTKSNPIVLDTFNADVDIANVAFGLSTAPVCIRKIVFQNPTAGDVVVLKNARLEVVATLKADATAGNTTQVEQDFPDGFYCQGLKIATADQTVTSGSVLIYV